MITATDLEFLKEIEQHNERDWFNENKIQFLRHKKNVDAFFKTVKENLNEHDQIDKLKIFRIYRDVRFSKNKLPYKSHFAASFHRVKPNLRGGYYIRIKPNDQSFIATGFWNPEKEDLLRIRKELERDASELREIIREKDLVQHWGYMEGDELKTAPRGFDKHHPDIDLIKKKQFIFTKHFSDKEVQFESFIIRVDQSYRAIRPFFEFMSDVLTTDLNGETVLE